MLTYKYKAGVIMINFLKLDFEEIFIVIILLTFPIIGLSIFYIILKKYLRRKNNCKVIVYFNCYLELKKDLNSHFFYDKIIL